MKFYIKRTQSFRDSMYYAFAYTDPFLYFILLFKVKLLVTHQVISVFRAAISAKEGFYLKLAILPSFAEFDYSFWKFGHLVIVIEI